MNLREFPWLGVLPLLTAPLIHPLIVATAVVCGFVYHLAVYKTDAYKFDEQLLQIRLDISALTQDVENEKDANTHLFLTSKKLLERMDSAESQLGLKKLVGNFPPR